MSAVRPAHAQNQTTGKSGMTGQSNVTFQPFSDFALHDMGTGLQDPRFSRLSQRTSIPYRAAVGCRTSAIFFLHDGRTSDIYQGHPGPCQPRLGKQTAWSGT